MLKIPTKHDVVELMFLEVPHINIDEANELFSLTEKNTYTDPKHFFADVRYKLANEHAEQFIDSLTDTNEKFKVIDTFNECNLQKSYDSVFRVMCSSNITAANKLALISVLETLWGVFE